MSSPRRDGPRARPLWEPAGGGDAAAQRYAHVALDLGAMGVQGLLTYSVPPELAERVVAGSRVAAPVASRPNAVPGVVFAVSADLGELPADARLRVRPLADVLPDDPLSQHQLELARFVAEQTASPLGVALRPVLPPGAALPRRRPVQGVFVRATDPPPELRTETQRRVWRSAAEAPGLTAAQLALRAGSRSVVDALLSRGLLERRAVEAPADDDAAADVAAAAAPQPSPVALNAEQDAAVRAIVAAAFARRPEVFLLWGVTGSGKTEVYLRAIGEVLRHGGQALVLVPEIALTPQTVLRFRERFGGAVTVMHSGLPPAHRRAAWRRASGDAGVVVGARSAVFAPLPRLGLIVVDEEHEPSYRQDEAPRYHARDVARWRGRALSVPVVLGSATPDVATFHAATQGTHTCLRLSTRAGGAVLPVVHIADRREMQSVAPRGPAHSALLLPPLVEAVTRHLQDGGQVLLYLNRRGFAPWVGCGACGYAARCQNCAVSLCYHEAQRALRCHYCGARRPAPRTCPRCGGAVLRLRGAGTERLAAETVRLWPSAAVLRMDLDTTARRGAHAAIFSAFRDGRADVLVGTQMIAKGWDIPRVTLVGVVDADTGLHLPDYRAAERTFQLLCQVAGRSGRGGRQGEVWIQTYHPDHPAVIAAAAHDYAGFAAQELAVRRAVGFPPFGQLVRLLSWAPRAADAEAGARALHRAVDEVGRPDGTDLWGPGAAPLERVRRQYRWQLALRGPDGAALRALARAAVQRAARGPLAARVAIDPDPLSML